MPDFSFHQQTLTQESGAKETVFRDQTLLAGGRREETGIWRRSKKRGQEGRLSGWLLPQKTLPDPTPSGDQIHLDLWLFTVFWKRGETA